MFACVAHLCDRIERDCPRPAIYPIDVNNRNAHTMTFVINVRVRVRVRSANLLKCDQDNARVRCDPTAWRRKHKNTPPPSSNASIKTNAYRECGSGAAARSALSISAIGAGVTRTHAHTRTYNGLARSDEGRPRDKSPQKTVV